MRTNKILLGIFIIASLMFSIAFISAYSVTSDNTQSSISNYPADNFLGRIISNIKFNGLYTVYGDTLGCSQTPNPTITWKNNILSGKTRTIFLDSGDAMFVDWFRGSPTDGIYSSHTTDSRQFMDEVYLEYGKTANNQYTITCDSGTYWNNDCYFDVYTCPKPCYANSDCTSGKICDKTVLSQKIPNAGVCKVSNPTHTTQVYRCTDGTKTSLGGVQFGNVNFCSNPSDSKYLIGSTDQCLSSQPTACSQIIQCSSGATKCGDAQSNLGTTYFICQNNAWVSQGKNFDNCGCNKLSLFGKDICVANSCSWNLGMCKDGTDMNVTGTLISLKKLSLTRDQISKSTNDDLFVSSCLSSSECLTTTNTEGYSVSCVSITSLRADGTLTQVGSDLFFDHSSKILNGALTGAGIGLGLGAIACIGGNIMTSTGALAAVGIPLAVIGCPALLSGGTAIGGAIAGASLANAIKPSDELVKKLQAKDANSVGICVAEESSSGVLNKYFGWASLIPIVQDKGINGLINVLIFLVILGIFFKK